MHAIAIAAPSAFRRPMPLTLGELQTRAPAVFAKAPAQRMSESYTMVRTFDVVERLLSRDMVITAAQQRRSMRDRLSARHVVRMAFKRDMQPRSAGELFPELVISNAHNGRASFKLYLGVFRVVCSNGLIIADSTFGFVVRRHIGDIRAILDEADEVMQRAPKVAPLVNRMERLNLTEAQRLQYARTALEARYLLEEEAPCAITPASLLVHRRPEDAKPTLWRTMNVVQENLMRGGVPSTSASGRKTHTRAMNNVGRALHVNEALWESAVAMLPH